MSGPVRSTAGSRVNRPGCARLAGMTTADWEQRVADAWASIDERDEAEFRTIVEKLVEELPPADPDGLFERAASLDSTGHSDLAVPLYEQALAAGPTGERRRRAVIQMSSSLRNLGRSQESVALLTAELEAGSDHLDDAVKTVLALALTDVGREREAVSIAVGALAAHLPRYQRSMANYARLLVEPDPAADPESDVRL
jgi:tetratricopeptide (TPR) repeat protein